MVEKIINNVIAKLDGKIPTDEIAKVRDILTVTLNDYEFTSKLHELSIVIPECLNIYLVTKKIEGKVIILLTCTDCILMSLFVYFKNLWRP